MSDDVRKLPSAGEGGQVEVAVSSHFDYGPFDDEEGRCELRARGDNELYLSIPTAEEDEFVTGGVDRYEALVKLTAPDFEERHWEPGREGCQDLSQVPSPGYGEMEELRQDYMERLEAASTDRAERRVLAEMWHKAGEMELDGPAAQDF
ncbi:MAG: hypothetical protein SVS85_01010 [Candidatus Nanohaloarchaea archaeon]|nr:hypothetical protein [Candidatus Nanohaloarchaea archaeon]